MIVESHTEPLKIQRTLSTDGAVELYDSIKKLLLNYQELPTKDEGTMIKVTLTYI